MRSRSRLPRPLVPALIILAVATLTGCVDGPQDAPQPTPTAGPTQTAAPEPSATPTPTPTAEPVSIDCATLVPPTSFEFLFRDFQPVATYAPAAGSVLQEVLESDGTVCGWRASDGSTVAVGVASLSPEALLAKKNDLVLSSNSVPTYGVEGYFQLVGSVGEAEAFTDPYWVVAASTVFFEPGDVEPIMRSAIAALQ